jgi:hypothetical protein
MSDPAAAGTPEVRRPGASLGVTNKYRSALLTATAAFDTGRQELTAAFDQVVAALRDGAWEGSAASSWFAELRGARTALVAALTEAAARCADAASAQPDQVPPDDWRARFAARLPRVILEEG